MTTLTDDTKELDELNTEFIAAVGAHDVGRLDAFFAEDFASTNPDGSFLTRADYLALVPALPTVSNLKGDDVTIRVFDDFAIVHTHISWVAHDGTPGHARFTDNYAKRDGRWQCVSAHVTTYPHHPVANPSVL
jgi:ketosteroid isomerase-like protein